MSQTALTWLNAFAALRILVLASLHIAAGEWVSETHEIDPAHAAIACSAVLRLARGARNGAIMCGRPDIEALYVEIEQSAIEAQRLCIAAELAEQKNTTSDARKRLAGEIEAARAARAARRLAS